MDLIEGELYMGKGFLQGGPPKLKATVVLTFENCHLTFIRRSLSRVGGEMLWLSVVRTESTFIIHNILSIQMVKYEITQVDFKIIP